MTCSKKEEIQPLTKRVKAENFPVNVRLSSVFTLGREL